MGAKKIGTGWYEYKGYRMMYIPREETNYGRGHWLIGGADSIECHDATQTKREAMILIDQYEKQGIAPNT